jgi:hypothetical protein
MENTVSDTCPLGPEQRRQLASRYGIREDELGKLLEDLWLLTNETVEDYARRRHAELQAAGIPNERGFTIIEREIAAGRFASPALSLRQVRRIIYG